MTRQVFILSILAVVVLFTTDNCLAQVPAGGQAPGQVSTPQAKPAAPPAPHDHSHVTKTTSAAANYFTDVELTNQDGKKVAVQRGQAIFY